MDIIVDIDGTIADCTHRLHFIKEKPRNFKKFMEGIPDDDPINPMVSLLKIIVDSRTQTPRLIYVTGRSEEYREQTIKWLNDQQLWVRNLFMRKKGDYRPDFEVKRDLLKDIRDKGYFPVLAFEDRDRCVEMYRNHGLICCQPAKGDY